MSSDSSHELGSRQCEHLVMVMLYHPMFLKGWICRDCGENVTRDSGYIIGLVALKVGKL